MRIQLHDDTCALLIMYSDMKCYQLEMPPPRQSGRMIHRPHQMEATWGTRHDDLHLVFEPKTFIPSQDFKVNYNSARLWTRLSRR